MLIRQLRFSAPPMHWLFRLFTLIALITAPLAAPAAAMASVRADSIECKSMDKDMSRHTMPAGHHRSGEACCVAVPVAIDPPLAALGIVPPLDHPIFVAIARPVHLGAAPKIEDPPPRPA